MLQLRGNQICNSIIERISELQLICYPRRRHWELKVINMTPIRLIMKRCPTLKPMCMHLPYHQAHAHI
jgi:hypothetical protein